MAIEVKPSFGRYDAAGNITRIPRTCSVTGVGVEDGDPIVRVPNTPLFFRVKSTLINRPEYPEWRAAIETEAKRQLAAEQPVVVEAPAEEAPAPFDKPTRSAK